MSLPVSLRLVDGMAVVTADNPRVHALGPAVRQGPDAAVGAPLVACAGQAFSAAADIRAFGIPPHGPALPIVIDRLETRNKPEVHPGLLPGIAAGDCCRGLLSGTASGAPT